MAQERPKSNGVTTVFNDYGLLCQNCRNFLHDLIWPQTKSCKIHFIFLQYLKFITLVPGSFWKKQGKKNKVSQLLKIGTYLFDKSLVGNNTVTFLWSSTVYNFTPFPCFTPRNSTKSPTWFDVHLQKDFVKFLWPS